MKICLKVLGMHIGVSAGLQNSTECSMKYGQTKMHKLQPTPKPHH